MNAEPIDVLIRGGRVVDGSGNPWFYGDVALSGDRVAGVAPPGQIPPEGAAEVVEASGVVVCPGFIDIQSHSILPLMRDGRCLSKVTQGITTEIMGETWTPAPFGGKRPALPGAWQDRARSWGRFGDWLGATVEAGVSPNVGSFLSGGTLRSQACGMRMGPATGDELGAMRRVMAGAMEDGAFGVSYALIYPPDTYVDTDEIVEVCRVVGRYGGIYITHMRSEDDRLLEGVEETLEIGRRAELPVEIYHLKVIGRQYWHKMPEVIRRIEAARASGQDVTADMYPYVASGTGLSTVLPAWVAADGRFYENLKDPGVRARIREEVERQFRDGTAVRRPEDTMPIGLSRPEHAPYAGRRLTEIAGMRGQDWLDVVFDLLLAEQQSISTLFFMVSEDNLKLQLRQPWIKVATDAGGVDPAWASREGAVHPRAYGACPRILGKYVREEGALTLEEAVRKMTSAVADRLGLRDRGKLQAGCWADVVVFDPERVADRATFEDPHRLSVGVRDVWVNGVRVVAGEAHTGATPGRWVKGPGAR